MNSTHTCKLFRILQYRAISSIRRLLCSCHSEHQNNSIISKVGVILRIPLHFRDGVDGCLDVPLRARFLADDCPHAPPGIFIMHPEPGEVGIRNQLVCGLSAHLIPNYHSPRTAQVHKVLAGFDLTLKAPLMQHLADMHYVYRVSETLQGAIRVHQVCLNEPTFKFVLVLEHLVPQVPETDHIRGNEVPRWSSISGESSQIGAQE